MPARRTIRTTRSRRDGIMGAIREFLRLPASNNDQHPAIRSAIGVGVPLLTLLALGHVELTIFAMLAALTSVFGRGLPHRPRLAQQWRAGLLMLACITGGLVVAQFGLPPSVIVALTAVVAALGLIAGRFARLKPDGSLLYVFAFAAIAFFPAAPPLWAGFATAAASVAFSVLVGVAGYFLPGHRTSWVAVPAEPLTVHERRNAYVEAALHVVTVVLAGMVSVWLGFGHTYWAMIAATAALVGGTSARRVLRGIHRILGAFGGLVITGILLSVHLTPWATVLVVIVLQFLVEYFVTRHYALAQTFVTPLALLMTEVVAPANPWSLIFIRGIETVVGAGIGMALVIFLHGIRTLPDEPEPAEPASA